MRCPRERERAARGWNTPAPLRALFAAVQTLPRGSAAAPAARRSSFPKTDRFDFAGEPPFHRHLLMFHKLHSLFIKLLPRDLREPAARLLSVRKNGGLLARYESCRAVAYAACARSAVRAERLGVSAQRRDFLPAAAARRRAPRALCGAAGAARFRRAGARREKTQRWLLSQRVLFQRQPSAFAVQRISRVFQNLTTT